MGQPVESVSCSSRIHLTQRDLQNFTALEGRHGSRYVTDAEIGRMREPAVAETWKYTT